jgi:hypothetical protein
MQHSMCNQDSVHIPDDEINVSLAAAYAQVWVGIHMPHGSESGLQGAIKRWRSTQTALSSGAELPSLIASTS